MTLGKLPQLPDNQLLPLMMCGELNCSREKKSENPRIVCVCMCMVWCGEGGSGGVCAECGECWCMRVHFCVCLCTYVCVDGEYYIPLLSGVNGNIIVWF